MGMTMDPRACAMVVLVVRSAAGTHRDFAGGLLDLQTMALNTSGAPLRRCPAPMIDVKKGRNAEGGATLARLGVKNMHIRGLFNTGTNYLSSILGEVGFPEANQDGGGHFDGSGAKRWKHAPLTSERGKAAAKNWNDYDLVLVRHPVPWALSTRTRSYELKCACGAEEAAAAARGREKKTCAEQGRKDDRGRVVTAMSWASVLRGPCDWPMGKPRPRGYRIVLSPPPHADGGLGDVWSTFYSSYLDSPRSIFVRYEDLVRDPTASVGRVARAARCSLPELTPGARKRLERTLNYRSGYYFNKTASAVEDDERQAVVDEAWRRDVDAGHLRALCRTVNATLLDIFHYTCVDDENPSPDSVPAPAPDAAADPPPAAAPPRTQRPAKVTIMDRVADLEARVEAAEAENAYLRAKLEGDEARVREELNAEDVKLREALARLEALVGVAPH